MFDNDDEFNQRELLAERESELSEYIIGLTIEPRTFQVLKRYLLDNYRVFYPANRHKNPFTIELVILGVL